jgi:hypothetical protein
VVLEAATCFLQAGRLPYVRQKPAVPDVPSQLIALTLVGDLAKGGASDGRFHSSVIRRGDAVATAPPAREKEAAYLVVAQVPGAHAHGASDHPHPHSAGSCRVVSDRVREALPSVN